MNPLWWYAPGAVALALLAAPASGAVMTDELARELARKTASDTVPVIIQMADRVDYRQYQVRSRRLRDNALVRALKDKATQSQAFLNAQLDQRGASDRKALWSINAVAATLPRWAIEELARMPAIGRIQVDAVVPFAATSTATATSAAWNLNALHIPDLWALGVTGSGVVVANMDTGVDAYHPDLAGKWRGGGNSWFDPYGQHAAPYDFSGHGTQTMGLVAGGVASGTAIGVAPNARWIAAKIYNDAGSGTLSNIHLAFQWLLDPDGNPATLDAPDIVNASWGLSGMAAGSCNLEFSDDIDLLGAAGILVVFAGGNEGPAPASSASPANNPGSFSAGAIDESFSVLSQSSRGPSGCDGTVFPRLAAPGVNVVTSDLSFGGMLNYATVSGTSFAAPHVAGAMALLAGAFPAATVAEIRNALTDTAQDLGGDGPDTAFGYGLTNAISAYNVLLAKYGASSAPAITSSPLTAAVENSPYSYQVVATDSSGAGLVYSLDTAPAGMAIQNGLISWTPSHAQVGTAAVTVRVTNAARQFSTQAYTIAVAQANGLPVAANDSYTVSAGSVLNIAAPGVLANDADPDGSALTAVLVAGPGHGALTLNANGSFSYAPAAGYSGADSFSYRGSDGQALGNTATVSLTVAAGTANKSPVAQNDSYSAPKRTSSIYAPQVFNVLSNDKDADGTINSGTVTIVSPPGQGGTVTVTSAGKVSYVPALRYTGTETFSYKVQDNRGAWSNTASVAVRVK